MVGIEFEKEKNDQKGKKTHPQTESGRSQSLSKDDRPQSDGCHEQSLQGVDAFLEADDNGRHGGCGKEHRQAHQARAEIMDTVRIPEVKSQDEDERQHQPPTDQGRLQIISLEVLARDVIGFRYLFFHHNP